MPKEVKLMISIDSEKRFTLGTRSLKKVREVPLPIKEETVSTKKDSLIQKLLNNQYKIDLQKTAQKIVDEIFI